MEKKCYITPNTEVITIKVQSHLLDASIVGTSMTEFSEEITTGGTTESADSRGFSIWDDEY